MSIRHVVGNKIVLRLFGTFEEAVRTGKPFSVYPMGFLALQSQGVFMDASGAVPNEIAHEVIEPFVVIAREDRTPEGEPGEYSLATRQVFSTRQEAQTYANGISESRSPLVVLGRFFNLRHETP